MARHRPTRFLAPLAILVVAGATYAIASSGLDSSTDDTSTTKRTSTSATTTISTSTTTVTSKPRTYVVRSGDTLSAISIETGVSVEHLQELNPDLDTQSLQPGQRLKLRN